MDVNEFWCAILTQNAEKIKLYFTPNAYVKWHCTNEQFTVDEFIRANCEYPGNWAGTVKRVLKVEDTVVTVTRVYPKDKSDSYHVTSFIQLKDGLIVAMDEYWADDTDAPKWRQKMKIGCKIK